MRFIGTVISLFGVLITSLIIVDAARILAVFPAPAKSHLLIHSSIAQTLAADDHNVTVIALFPDILSNTQYTSYIHIDGKPIDPSITKDMMEPKPFYMKISQLLNTVFDSANDTMNHSKMQDFLQKHKPGDFDLIILGYFMNDFMLGLGAHFQCPIVISFMVQPIVPINEMIGNPLEISYVPSLLMDIRPPMTFGIRIKNFIAIGFERWIMGSLMKWKNNQLYR